MAGSCDDKHGPRQHFRGPVECGEIQSESRCTSKSYEFSEMRQARAAYIWKMKPCFWMHLLLNVDDEAQGQIILSAHYAGLALGHEGLSISDGGYT